MADFQTDEANISYHWLVLDTVRKMRDAKSALNITEFFTQFEFALQMLLPYLDMRDREAIEADYQILKRYISELRINATGKNEQTVNREINLIKEEFADAHRYFIFLGMSRAGIIKVADDGLIDFESKDFDEIKKLVRSGGGLPSKLEKLLDEKGDKDGSNKRNAHIGELTTD